MWEQMRLELKAEAHTLFGIDLAAYSLKLASGFEVLSSTALSSLDTPSSMILISAFLIIAQPASLHPPGDFLMI